MVCIHEATPVGKKKKTKKKNKKQKHYMYFFYFLGPHLIYMEVSRLGVESVLQLQAYTTATAMPDPSHI